MNRKYILLILWSVIILLKHGDGARVLGLFPLAFNGHFVMFEQVMKSLAGRGHQVEVLSFFPQKEPYPNYTDISIADSVPVVTSIVSYHTMQNFASASLKSFIDLTGNDVCKLLALPQLQELIKNPPSDPPYDLVVVELFYANCYLAFGRHLNVPVVAMTSSPMLPYTNEPLGNPLNTAYMSEIGEGSISYLNFWQRLKNTVWTWIMCYESRHHTEIQNDIVKKYFGPEMPGVRQLEQDVALLLVNTHHTLNGNRPMTSAVVEVGGIHIRDEDIELDEELQTWLDDSKTGFIYFSFGSMVAIESLPEEKLLEFYTAFSMLAPLRVLMKVNEPKYLPPGLPDNVLTFSWVPQVQILKHENVRGFVTHGGLLGVQEAVAFGVPLVGIPLFHDQTNNVQNCVDRGAAIKLDYDDLKSEKIVAAINAVVHNPKYRGNMMELSARFLDRPIDARETALFWIEYILRYGKDALRSPAVNLTWWQLALLDIYGIMIAAALITVCLIKSLLVQISRAISYSKRKSARRSMKKID